MRKLLVVFALASVGIPTAGCAVQAPVVPPIAGLFTDVHAPLDVDFDNTKVALKKGESSSMSILGLVAVGDASSRTAAANGDIKTIESADYRYFNVFGVYQRYTTIVYGE